jgi:hypothetical protein
VQATTQISHSLFSDPVLRCCLRLAFPHFRMRHVFQRNLTPKCSVMSGHRPGWMAPQAIDAFPEMQENVLYWFSNSAPRAPEDV